MSRKPRTEFPGAIYHVFQRGNNKRYIFQQPFLKEFYLSQLEKFKDEMGYEVFAYVLMNNHYHLLLQTNGEGLGKIMHRLNSIFSSFYNRNCEHINHVFGDRYSAVLATNENYLLWVLKYIHNNPVKAGLCKDASSYSWSSDLYYKSKVTNFINVDFLLDIINPERKKAVQIYSRYMKEGDVKEYCDEEIQSLEQDKLELDIEITGKYNINLRDKVHISSPIAFNDMLSQSNNFELPHSVPNTPGKSTVLIHPKEHKSLEKNLETGLNTPKFKPEFTQDKRYNTNDASGSNKGIDLNNYLLTSDPTHADVLEMLIKDTINDMSIFKMIQEKKKHRWLTPYKRKAILAAYRHHYTLEAIAQKLNMTASGVHRLLAIEPETLSDTSSGQL